MEIILALVTGCWPSFNLLTPEGALITWWGIAAPNREVQTGRRGSWRRLPEKTPRTGAGLFRAQPAVAHWVFYLSISNSQKLRQSGVEPSTRRTGWCFLCWLHLKVPGWISVSCPWLLYINGSKPFFSDVLPPLWNIFSADYPRPAQSILGWKKDVTLTIILHIINNIYNKGRIFTYFLGGNFCPHWLKSRII